jgi:hypothetical protein
MTTGRSCGGKLLCETAKSANRATSRQLGAGMALLRVFRGLPGGAILRKSSAQARIEGRNPTICPDDDFEIIDGATPVGRIYRELILGEPKWLSPVIRSPRLDPEGRFRRPLMSGGRQLIP